VRAQDRDLVHSQTGGSSPSHNLLPPGRNVPPLQWRGRASNMFTKLSDASKAAIFSVLVLAMAVGAALPIRMLCLTSGMGM
jgi:hypothetical protein